MTLTVRPMIANDAPACTDILNDIIARGGTTAYEDPYTVEGFDAHYRAETAISMVVLFDGDIIGFQGLFEVSPGVYSIGSFTDRRSAVKGAGSVMFKATLDAAKLRGGSEILAKITSDNTGGLSYYARMGFEDYEIQEADLTRSDGTIVDRVIKRLAL